jgi:uncharacterized protein (DUF1778 family)
MSDAGASIEKVELVLSADKWQAFCEALDRPPRDIPELRKLLTEPSVLDDQVDAADSD